MRPRGNQGKMRSEVINNTIMPEWRESIMFHSTVQWNDLSYITTDLNHGNRVPAVTDPV